MHEFCYALSTLKTAEEISAFLTDLLSSQEVEMLARRVRIARALLEGDRFSDISWKWKVSSGTISRIHQWLKSSGEGYRIIWERMKSYEPPELTERRELPPEPFSARWMRRRYPMYYWPQALLEEIIRSAKKRKREQLLQVVEKLDVKSAIYKQLAPLLKEAYGPKGPLRHIQTPRRSKQA
ncbi:hypothetical protein HYW30_01400 [Candidatus Azambacteria bacterium]|nr:hypothetical protein [Candidatus Azambacteria bacterium]